MYDEYGRGVISANFSESGRKKENFIIRPHKLLANSFYEIYLDIGYEGEEDKARFSYQITTSEFPRDGSCQI